ncbi:MAG: hypothetical protein AAFY98_03950 [Verrucomicrobiota bacterium]
MFSIDLVTLFDLYLIGFLGLVTGIWLLAAIKRRRDHEKELVKVQCAHCDHIFGFDNGVRWVRCPKCHAGMKVKPSSHPPS